MMGVDELKALKELFETEYHESCEIKEIPGGGSHRKYYRLTDGEKSVIGVVSSDTQENNVFFHLDKILEEEGIKVPHIIKISSDKKTYLLQDLGDISLFSLLNSPEKMEMSKQVLRDLVKIQNLPENAWRDFVGFPPFSERLIRWDLNYFKYDFLKPMGIIFDEEKLEDDFDKMVNLLTSSSMITGLMYRDFQSRNIMVKDTEFWYIDFQGARKGPLTYDAVSFIWQAKAPFSFPEREELEHFYIDLLSEVLNTTPLELAHQMKEMKIFRILQVLGAYGFRGLIERKTHFLESITYGIRNLEYISKKGYLKDYPEIERIAGNLAENNRKDAVGGDKNLTVSVYSFSYKKGYPEDRSGNGGGFMFDCRAIHNPGRYEEYKSLTGKDCEVIEFLEKTEETKTFVEKAVELVSPSIERYLKRGFSSLQVGFGCTGGQHRSVYCAERFARLISQKYPETNIRLHHREQGISIKL